MDDAQKILLTRFEVVRRFGVLLWPFRWYLFPAIVAMVILAATSGAIAFLVQPILDEIFIKQDRQMMYSLPLIVTGIFLVRGATFFVQSYLMEYVGLKVVRQLQVRMYQQLLTMDMSFFLNTTTGSLISRVMYDTTMLKGAASTVTSDILREGLSVVLLVGVVIYRDPYLAAIALLGLPGAGFLIYNFGRRMRRLSQNRQEMMEGVTAHLEETVSGQRIVKAFCMEPYERAKFRKLTKKMLRNQLGAAMIRSTSNPSMDMVAGFAISAVIFFGGHSVISGATTTGAFFSFLTAILLAYNPVKRLTGLNNALQESLAAARRIFDFLDIQSTIVDAPNATPLPPMQHSLTFRDVVFSYGSDLQPVLNGINLEVRVGERVAIVGRSGNGKSTLVNLVPRFFDVTSGTILIDGMDIRQATIRSLREQIAVVTQDVILFNDTVLNNIAYGHRDRPHELVVAAAQAANALEFIHELPEQFRTVIGDRGVRLSGGQRQRLSIARSLLKNAPILILDEATSSLDTESEKAVQEALERLMEGRTSLVIAHRLSTIKNADRIVVVGNGVIVEEGNHDELLALGGEYAKLYEMQFQDKPVPIQ